MWSPIRSIYISLLHIKLLNRCACGNGRHQCNRTPYAVVSYANAWKEWNMIDDDAKRSWMRKCKTSCICDGRKKNPRPRRGLVLLRLKEPASRFYLTSSLSKHWRLPLGFSPFLFISFVVGAAVDFDWLKNFQGNACCWCTTYLRYSDGIKANGFGPCPSVESIQTNEESRNSWHETIECNLSASWIGSSCFI